MGNIWQFLKKLKIALSHDPAITFGHTPKGLAAGLKEDICIPMFIVLFTITETRKQFKYLLMDEQMSKMLLYTQRKNILLKTKEILTCATTQMSLEDITLSERNQS